MSTRTGLVSQSSYVEYELRPVCSHRERWRLVYSQEISDWAKGTTDVRNPIR